MTRPAVEGAVEREWRLREQETEFRAPWRGVAPHGFLSPKEGLGGEMGDLYN